MNLSYAVRNTIALVVTLIIMAGGSWLYLNFFQKPEIEELNKVIQQKKNDLNSKRTIVDGYPALVEAWEQANASIASNTKALYPNRNPDAVFDFLTLLNSGNSIISYDFTYADTVLNNQYGMITTTINGNSTYRAFVNYLNKLENSQLINKVQDMNLLYNDRAENYNEVIFTFQIESLYERAGLELGIEPERSIRMLPEVSVNNPFYPLIRTTFDENINNLPNVESSRLVGLNASRIFLVNQDGRIVTLRVGDVVYLGKLQAIYPQQRKAEFLLNKGGITEIVTLQVN